jgi:hypothetical protein
VIRLGGANNELDLWFRRRIGRFIRPTNNMVITGTSGRNGLAGRCDSNPDLVYRRDSWKFAEVVRLVMHGDLR